MFASLLAAILQEGFQKKRGYHQRNGCRKRRDDSPSLHASRAVTWLTVYRAPQVACRDDKQYFKEITVGQMTRRAFLSIYNTIII